VDQFDDDDYKYFVRDTKQEQPHKDYTLEECEDLATDSGVTSFTYRGPNYSAIKWRNSCVLLNKPSGYVPRSIQSTNTVKSGCVDPSKTWPNCN